MFASSFSPMPTDPPASIRDAEEAMHNGQYEQAVSILRHCLLKNSDRKTKRKARSLLNECYSKLSTLSLQAGDWVGLSRWMREAVEEFPDYPDFHYNLAVALRRLGKPADALHHIEKSLTKNPQNARAILYQGLLWYELGQTEQGLRRIEEAVSREPAFYTPAFERAKWMHLSGNTEAAMVLFESLEMQTDQNSRSLREEAEKAIREGRFSDAALIYKELVQLCPDYPDIRCQYASVLIELGQYGTAREQLQIALEKNPSYSDALSYLAQTLLALGQVKEARVMLQRLREIDPDHPGLEHPRLAEL